MARKVIVNNTRFDNIGGYPSEMNLNRLEKIAANIQNASTTLSRRGTNYGDGDDRRSIDDECGYPNTEDLDPDSYRFMYDRFGVAERVVNVLPKESWGGQPEIFEDEDTETETAFEKAWIELGNQLRGDSKYKDEKGSPIWEYLTRLDIISGIGSYGIMLLGFDDQKQSLADPVETKDGMKLLYLQTYDESLVTISKWDEDPTSPRYLHPEMYEISFGDPRTYIDTPYPRVESKAVHWTRVIHVADNLLNNEILGVPRMRPVYNHLYDLRKLYGGSGEMYWKGAFPGYFFETHPQLGPDVQVNTSSVASQMEQMQNSLQRWGVLNGMSANQMAPQVVDPTPQIERGLDAICIQIPIPKRIFVGSERGELASSQDQDLHDRRMMDRQQKHNTPRIIIPFVDRLIEFGVLPEPEGYGVKWPKNERISPTEKSSILVQRTEAMSKYVGGGVDQLIQPEDFLSKEMGYSEEEAQEIIDAAFSPETTPDDPTSMFKPDAPDPFEIEAAKQGAFPERKDDETGKPKPFIKPGETNIERAARVKKENESK